LAVNPTLRTNSEQGSFRLHAGSIPITKKAIHLATLRQIDFGHKRIALLNGPLEYTSPGCARKVTRASWPNIAFNATGC
jgi:hypothetical protein